MSTIRIKSRNNGLVLASGHSAPTHGPRLREQAVSNDTAT
jgi:hypothetical protein